MRISRVYTKTGDGGQTSLVGGRRVSKSNARVEAYGDVDELNSLLGVVRSFLKDEEIDASLGRIQNDLFIVGADLASPSDIEVPRVGEALVQALEADADHFLHQVEPLKEFILPGGGQAGALLHLARAVARRAERRVVALGEVEEINAGARVYLNRLSDLLFIMARAVNHRAGAPEKQAEFSKRKA